MKLQYKKLIVSFVLMLVTICSTPVFAFNNDINDDTLSIGISEKLGSITITYKNIENSSLMTNMHVAVTRIADYIDGEYIMLPQFLDAKVDLNALSTANDVEDSIKRLVKIAKPEQIYIADRNGMIKIDNVPIGVYLIYSTEIEKDIHMNPCLVSIPIPDEKNGEMLYDIEMIPKCTPVNIDKEQAGIFQTGIDNYTTEYAGLSLLMLSITAAILFVSGSKREL